MLKIPSNLCLMNNLSFCFTTVNNYNISYIFIYLGDASNEL